MQTIFQVDAFTNRPFQGNPAAVCILREARDAQWMQNIALEMNLSETAFLVEQKDGFDLRWFTPACEVDLCGHATLASAHVLWETGVLSPSQEAYFHTRSGLLSARKKGEWIEMNFPAEPANPCEYPTELREALGLAPSDAAGLKNRLDYLIEVDSEQTVRNMKPDFNRLTAIQVRGVIVTSRSESTEYDFVSRFFAPGVGIHEDPVTGSAHCCLAPYWSQILGKASMVGYQASARGGIVRVQVIGDRVILGGQAVTVMRGELEC